MTEEQAQAWVRAHVSRETVDRLEQFVVLLLAENRRQNLVSPASEKTLWARHIVDSLQLLDHAPATGTWVDLGTGAGFPGMIVGMLGRHDVTLIESRAKRIDHLRRAAGALSIGERTEVFGGRVEMLLGRRFDIISARAFAPLDRLLSVAHHLAGPATRWILPKGRSAQAELDVARGSWQGDFSVVPSITDPDAAIIVAENVRPRGGERRSRS